jgi:hypothetical protein
MAAITAKSRVVFERNRFGQFAAACDEAAERTVQRTVDSGARTSRALAPSSGKNVASYSKRPGYVPLKRSIRTHVAGTRGYWYSIAPHALFVEEGTSAHLIKGYLNFYWKGGHFVWNNPEFGPVGSGKPYENWDESGAWVRHPGTGAQPFLRPAYERVAKRQMMEIAREEYPG